MENLIMFLAGIAFWISFILSGVHIGREVMGNDIKDHKLIIIDNSSYRCKMVKTLEVTSETLSK